MAVHPTNGLVYVASGNTVYQIAPAAGGGYSDIQYAVNFWNSGSAEQSVNGQACEMAARRAQA